MIENKKTQQLLPCIKTLALILAELGLSIAVIAINPVGALASDNGLMGQEKTIISLTNQLRNNTGLDELTVDKRLMSSARNKALDMATRGYFDHASPEGNRMAYWITDAGYNYSLAGENLAKGFTSADRLVQAWASSFSHYVNLVEPKFKNVGVGIAEGVYYGQTTIFVVQHFGVEQTSPIHISLVGGQNPELKNFISPITNVIGDRQTAVLATLSEGELIQNQEVVAEVIERANVENEPPTTGGGSPSNWSMLGLFAVMVLAILGYLEEQFSILQIQQALFLRRIFKTKARR